MIDEKVDQEGVPFDSEQPNRDSCAAGYEERVRIEDMDLTPGSKALLLLSVGNWR